MKSNFTPGRVSTTLEIFIKSDQNEFFDFYKKALDYLTDPELYKPPVQNFPKVTGYIVKPRSYIYLESKDYSKKFLREFLSRILNTHPEYLKDLILVGRKWLKSDIDGLPKSDRNFNYIVFEQKILKVITSKNNYTDKLSSEIIDPQSWVWMVQIKHL